MGTEGCRHIVDAIDTAVRERVPVLGLWHSGGARLAEGVRRPRRGRPGLRRDGPGLRPGAADLGGARPGGRRRRVRPGADRHRDHERGRAHLRHRPGGGPQRHRRAGRHGAPRRPGAARPPLRRRARDHPGRGVGAGAGPRARRRCSAGRGGSARPTWPSPTRRTTSPRRCRSRPTAPTTSSRSSTRCSTTPAWSCTPSGRRTSSPRWAGFAGRTVGVIANNPLRLGGCLDAVQRREGRPVRADVRLARRAADRAGRRPRLPARRWARSGTAWCAAARSCCTPSPRRWCRG